MGWERRGNRSYYYRATKANGRVVKQYVGAGPLAGLVAAQDDEARAERATAAESQRVERNRFAGIDRTVTGIDETIEALLRTCLVVSGYHQHRRGEWRRRRDG